MEPDWPHWAVRDQSGPDAIRRVGLTGVIQDGQWTNSTDCSANITSPCCAI